MTREVPPCFARVGDVVAKGASIADLALANGSIQHPSVADLKQDSGITHTFLRIGVKLPSSDRQGSVKRRHEDALNPKQVAKEREAT